MKGLEKKILGIQVDGREVSPSSCEAREIPQEVQAAMARYRLAPILSFDELNRRRGEYVTLLGFAVKPEQAEA